MLMHIWSLGVFLETKIGQSIMFIVTRGGAGKEKWSRYSYCINKQPTKTGVDAID